MTQLFSIFLLALVGPARVAAQLDRPSFPEPPSTVGNEEPGSAELGCYLVFALRNGSWRFECWYACTQGDIQACTEGISWEDDGDGGTFYWCDYECGSEDCYGFGHLGPTGYWLDCYSLECMTEDCQKRGVIGTIPTFQCNCIY